MGTTTPNMAIYVPSSGEDLYRTSFAAGQGNIDLHQHTGPSTGGAQLISQSYSDGSITPDKLSNQVRQSANYIANFGMSYAGGVFAITSADGSALSSTNKAYVTFQNQISYGQLVTIAAQANSSFNDHASGSSTIAGNTFGYLSGTDTLAAVQFYVYAVSKHDNSDFVIMISLLPCQAISPVSSNIGMPSTPAALFDNSFWCFKNITATDYDTSPCVELGCFRMKKVGGALDDWTVQGLTAEDGIGSCNCSDSESPNPDVPSPTVGTSNLGITYTGAIFKVTGADGNALQANNKGYVTMPSTVPGQLITIPVDIDQQFVDNVGISTIAGNLFGMVNNVNYGNDLPFYIYAVLDTSSTTVSFMIARMPNLKTSPVAGSIGTEGTPNASTQGSMYALKQTGGSPIVPSQYASQPCLLVGSFRMTKTGTTANDWKVSSLSGTDGMDQYQESTSFSIPASAFNARSGGVFVGAASPIFTTQQLTYLISKSGMVRIAFDGANCSTAGTDTFNLSLVIPFFPNSTTYTTDEYPVGIAYNLTGGGASCTGYFVCVLQGTQATTFVIIAGGAFRLLNNGIAATTDFRCTFNYQI